MQNSQPSLPSPQQQSNQKIIDRILTQNSQLLAQIMQQSKSRKNKNLISTRLAILIHQLEKNLIKVGKMVPPQCLGDPKHIEEQKSRFVAMYHRKSGAGVKK